MKKRNEFYLMDKREAYAFIWDCVYAWSKTYGDNTGRLEDNICRLIDNYNDNNVLGERIDYYEVSDDEINDGCRIGIGIEDETFIYPEFAEAWNAKSF